MTDEKNLTQYEIDQRAAETEIRKLIAGAKDPNAVADILISELANMPKKLGDPSMHEYFKEVIALCRNRIIASLQKA